MASGFDDFAVKRVVFDDSLCQTGVWRDVTAGGHADLARYHRFVDRPQSAPIPISAVLITLDAEQWLEKVLAPLEGCNEILILDSGSTDRTRAIAEGAGAVWFEQDFAGYGPQKRRAVELASHDWILSVDADEILDVETVAALQAMDWRSLDPHLCFSIRRRPFVGEREIRHGHWVPDPVVRVFNRRVHNFTDAPVHESVVATGAVRRLPGAMAHHSHQDLAEIFRLDYHRLKAAEYRRRGRRIPGVASLAFRAAWAFAYSLVLRRGMLDGRAGLVIALSAAVNAVLGLALAGEKAQGSDRDSQS